MAVCRASHNTTAMPLISLHMKLERERERERDIEREREMYTHQHRNCNVGKTGAKVSCQRLRMMQSRILRHNPSIQTMWDFTIVLDMTFLLDNLMLRPILSQKTKPNRERITAIINWLERPAALQGSCSFRESVNNSSSRLH
mmetsp:Transcript_98191/g.155309  ORF Transcript_98191/g.155309 Transcript_98191/m.155309 type:complete len:142 (-) Transcript_98191:1673-2098(-)